MNHKNNMSIVGQRQHKMIVKKFFSRQTTNATTMTTTVDPTIAPTTKLSLTRIIYEQIAHRHGKKTEQQFKHKDTL